MKNILTLLAISILFFACGSSAPDKKSELDKLKKEEATLSDKIKKLETEIAASDTTTKIKMLDVEVTPVAAMPFKSYVQVQGKLDADENVNVSAQMGGTVKSIYVKEGDHVKAGQILAELDDAVMRQGVEELKSQLAFVTDLFNKQKNLWDQKIGSEVQFLSAKNNKEALEKKIQTMNEQLAMYKIKSPISGTVDEVNLKLGQTAAPGIPAFRVVNMSSLKVKADIAESYAAKIHEGNAVTVEFPDMVSKSMDSKISFVSKVINSMNRTFVVEVNVPTDPELHPNMIAHLKIVDYQSVSSIVIPLNIVQTSEDGSYVFLSTTNDKGKMVAHKQIVKTGRDSNGQVEILEGLKEGDSLITIGYQDVEDGELIKI
ncbi:MAG: efflux RND transporter periplasmic adaptor subunit [Sphingobacteriales bacterium]|nr:MAG: efflux RND transporter periplasmic adaptor subunit [Sphingobacteriales bacterium]